MFIFPPSGLACDLEFGFGSFELKILLICSCNKNVRPSADCQAARPLSDCCGRSKQRRQARGAPGRSSIHTFSARAPSAEPSSPASPSPRCTHVSTANQVACVQFDVAAARRQQCAARRSPPHFFPALAISLFISDDTYHLTMWGLFSHESID